MHKCIDVEININICIIWNNFGSRTCILVQGVCLVVCISPIDDVSPNVGMPPWRCALL